jgi:hypothetical protein
LRYIRVDPKYVWAEIKLCIRSYLCHDIGENKEKLKLIYSTVVHELKCNLKYRLIYSFIHKLSEFQK